MVDNIFVLMVLVPETINSLLHHCSKVKALRHGLAFHAAVLKAGMQSDICTSNHVINMYAKCGNVKSACRMFDQMFEKNIVSWSAMISGYVQAGQHLMALDLFSKMHLVPNEFIYASAISACANLVALSQGQQIHAQALQFGYASISFVSNSLISMYMKCGHCDDALSVHGSASEQNTISYNALVGGFLENDQPEKGLEVFKLMQRQGLVPDRFTFVEVLGICSNSNNLRTGMVLHCQTIKRTLATTHFVGNVIMTMYSKFNLIEEAEKVFRLIQEKDVISWNTLITACSHCNDHAKGFCVYKEMRENYGVKPDDFTFASVLAACARLPSIHHGKQIHAYLIKTKLSQDVGVDNALVCMYAKCGSFGYAYNVFNKMLHRNAVSWNTIIAGFGNHGLGRQALELFERMKAMGVNPDSVTFVGVLMACNHAGLVDRGKSIFNSMEEIYGIAPDIEHFSCLIDMLGRAGRLTEAEEYMKKFPFGHDPVVLGTLLSACRLHHDVVIGERLARDLLELQPVTSSPYVLLSNLYASDEFWDGAAKARKMLKSSGLKKEPGYSLIEVNGSFKKFTVGEYSHSRIEEIRDTLKSLSCPVCEVSLNDLT
nr:pentatricopeptide repeat-containing protein At5g27110-like isoform X1 [Ziziphus jujuba var. spinosa]XP_048323449.1 pentatricopeptide repeat-containing protein At5g27110-like isoform X1 [Ziziphus jujuba var. spinosa]